MQGFLLRFEYHRSTWVVYRGCLKVGDASWERAHDRRFTGCAVYQVVVDIRNMMFNDELSDDVVVR